MAGIRRKNKALEKWGEELKELVSPGTTKAVFPRKSVDELCLTMSRPQASIMRSSANINLFLAGQGSGKTHTLANRAYYYISNFPKSKGFIAANTDMQLSDSTLEPCFKIWASLGLSEYNQETQLGHYVVGIIPPESWGFPKFKSYKNKLFFENGALVFLGSLENYKAHDGKEFAWCVLDETKDTREEAFKEVILGRVRQQAEHQNTIDIFTSPAKVDWLNDFFCLSDYENEIYQKVFSQDDYFEKRLDNKYVVISSTYHNIANLPPDYIPNQKKNLDQGLQDMLIYGCPFSKSGGEFYKDFNRAAHIGRPMYNENEAIHLTFDFNVNPGVTANVWQIYGGFAYQIDEILVRSPKNTTLDACKEFDRRYPSHKAGLFIYGDPSGASSDTRGEYGSNDYTLIVGALSKFNPVKKVDKKAPGIVARGNFINWLFRTGKVKIFIHEKCTITLADYTYMKEKGDGTKDKKPTKNPSTGITEEKFGHPSDANDYMLCRIFREEKDEYERGGRSRFDMITGIFKRNLSR